MKRIIAILTAIIAAAAALAQDIIVPEPLPDSAAVLEVHPSVNPDYAGLDIFTVLSIRSVGQGKVSVNQSDQLLAAFRNQIESNSSRKVNGYRVRIYSGNTQDARRKSEDIAAGFAASFPGIPVYKSYTNPFFKVTIGDFRTKAEASRFAASIMGRYPTAFLVKEPINYPSLW